MTPQEQIEQLGQIEARHTPGPWEAVKTPNGFTVLAPHGRTEADCPGENLVFDLNSPYASSENEANARLIAAAPELLRIAKELDRWERDPDRFRGDLADLAVEARATIAKALNAHP